MNQGRFGIFGVRLGARVVIARAAVVVVVVVVVLQRVPYGRRMFIVRRVLRLLSGHRVKEQSAQGSREQQRNGRLTAGLRSCVGVTF